MTANTGTSARVLHASLAVDDVDCSRSFYERALSAKVVLEARDMTDLIRRTTGIDQLSCDLVQLRFASNGVLLELIAFRDVPPDRQDDVPVRIGHGHVCLGVMNFDEALARAQACGAIALGDVVTFPEGRSVYLREPGGSVLELEEVDK